MRRRDPILPTPPGAAPPELAIGACIEVWAPDARSVFDAWRRHRAARRRWAEDSRLSAADVHRLAPAGPPWSAEFLLEHGGAARLQQYLDRAGVTTADLPGLRLAAAQRAAEDPAAGPASRIPRPTGRSYSGLRVGKDPSPGKVRPDHDRGLPPGGGAA